MCDKYQNLMFSPYVINRGSCKHECSCIIKFIKRVGEKR